MAKKHNKKYVADFETTSDDGKNTRVYLWGALDRSAPDEEHFVYGKDLDSFIEHTFKNPGTYHFHNLKFDGSYILTWLLKNGYKFTNGKLESGKFKTLITDSGAYFKISYRKNNKCVNLLDSLKLLNMSISEMANFIGLEEEKQIIDYNKPRPVGYEPTIQELHYLYIDCLIPAKSLNFLEANEIDRMTIASSALKSFKSMVDFKKLFPAPSEIVDSQLRNAYRGGYCILNPEYEDITVENVNVLDVNSLYPYVMAKMPIPYGKGVYFEGEPIPDAVYNLYIVSFYAKFELKKDHLPTLQEKSNLLFLGNKYISSSKGNRIALTLSSVDFELFMSHYDVEDLSFNGGYYFRSSTLIFSEYIEHWYQIKKGAKESGNIGLYGVAKLMQNSLYGKFAFSPFGYSKQPFLDKDGILDFVDADCEQHKLIYIPAAIFITAWARSYTIRNAQKIFMQKDENGRSLYIYSDTDSIHYINTADLSQLHMDEYELGAWKIERCCTRAHYIRQKTYLQECDGKLKPVIAGLSPDAYHQVNFGNFKRGAVYIRKRAVNGIGGQIVKDLPFRIL